MSAYLIFQSRTYDLIRNLRFIWVPQYENNGKRKKHDYSTACKMSVGDTLFIFYHKRLQIIGKVTESSHILCPDSFAAIKTGWKEQKGVKVEFIPVTPKVPMPCETVAGFVEDENVRHKLLCHQSRSNSQIFPVPDEGDRARILNRALEHGHGVGHFDDVCKSVNSIESVADEYTGSETYTLVHAFDTIKVPDEIPTRAIKEHEAPKRDLRWAKCALERDEYTCQCQGVAEWEHGTFLARNKFYNYHEPHHLIPLGQYDRFPGYNPDHPANIVCLCSTCHKCIHYGDNALREKLICHLYKLCKQRLKKAGLNISFKKLLECYDIRKKDEKRNSKR